LIPRRPAADNTNEEEIGEIIMATQIGKKTFWQQYKTPILLLGGIALGSLIGVVAPGLGQNLKPVGDIFLNLLFTIVVPLVFVSIACAVGSMANMNRLGKILGGTVAAFLGTGAIAAACVLIWVNLFSPSAGTNIQMEAAEVGEVQSAAEMIVGSLTVSDFPELWSKSHKPGSVPPAYCGRCNTEWHPPRKLPPPADHRLGRCLGSRPQRTDTQPV